jgi:hypothetical protein
VGAVCTWWCAWTSNPVEGMVDMSSVGSIPTRSRQTIKKQFINPNRNHSFAEKQAYDSFFSGYKTNLIPDRSYTLLPNPDTLFQ